MSQPKTWSLLREIYMLEAGVAGARMLVDLVAREGAQDDHDARFAPEAASAVLELVGLRTRELTRMLRGEVVAETFWAPTNACGPNDDGDDVLFRCQQSGDTRAR